MRSFTSCSLPLTTAVTMPPPGEASTVFCSASAEQLAQLRLQRLGLLEDLADVARHLASSRSSAARAHLAHLAAEDLDRGLDRRVLQQLGTDGGGGIGFRLFGHRLDTDLASARRRTPKPAPRAGRASPSTRARCETSPAPRRARPCRPFAQPAGVTEAQVKTELLLLHEFEKLLPAAVYGRRSRCRRWCGLAARRRRRRLAVHPCRRIAWRAAPSRRSTGPPTAAGRALGTAASTTERRSSSSSRASTSSTGQQRLGRRQPHHRISSTMRGTEERASSSSPRRAMRKRRCRSPMLASGRLPSVLLTLLHGHVGEDARVGSELDDHRFRKCSSRSRLKRSRSRPDS